MPLEMPLQGVLRDNAGAPVAQGEFPMTFAIYAAADAADALWTETLGVTVQGGQFRLNLGTITPLSPTLFAASGALWLGITVESEPELPRRPMGTTPYAFQSASASGLSCSGCVEPEALSPAALQVVRDEALIAVAAAGYATDAGGLAVDAAALGVEATTVQGALETLKSLIEGQTSASNVNEGAGGIRGSEHQWGLPSYGVAKNFVHIMNPTPPKVLLHLYGGENTGFASSNNLIVSNTYTPNTYSGGVNGGLGDDTMTVDNAGAFNQGDHILIHQTMGDGAGGWELNAVQAINGNSLKLAKPLTRDFVSDSSTSAGMNRAQVVIAASYNTFEVVNGGVVRPSTGLPHGSTAAFYGGIVYIRARQLTVKNGGVIHADGYGFAANTNQGVWNNWAATGGSECGTHGPTQSSPNCSGGGGGWASSNSCTHGNNSGSGGGGNRTAGERGYQHSGGQSGGEGGLAKGAQGDGQLHFGGAGGEVEDYDGGYGGGLVVLGAETLIVESGARISADGGAGGDAACRSGTGGGAGGMVALFATTISSQGAIRAEGGAGYDHTNGTADGGDGGEGWVLEIAPIPGIVNQSYATGVQIWVDGQEVTPLIGDPNGKGLPHWNATEEAWGGTGTEAWFSGPLDLTNVASWTPGEHILEFRETGGAGGDLKAYLYLIQRFSESQPPVNDTCTTPVAIDLSDGPVVLGGTTEDVMGKTLATDASSDELCGGSGGPDVVYWLTLDERALINAVVTAPFYARLYVRSADCTDGDVVYCGANEIQTNPLDPGDYFLFVDSDAESQKGDFSLAVSLTPAPLPVQDTCDDAMQLIFSGQGIATHAGTTLYGLDQYQAWCDVAGGGADAVYQFQAATGESITIDVAADFDSLVYVYMGECGTGAVISCADQGNLFIPPQQGGTYFLVIDGADEKEWGGFDLTVTLQ